jgi:hypothetical protein
MKKELVILIFGINDDSLLEISIYSYSDNTKRDGNKAYIDGNKFEQCESERYQ